MKLKIRYENGYQTIVLTEQDTEAMWVSLALEGDDLTQEERENRIQEAFEEQYNRPEYNCWHKFDRHHGTTKVQHFGEGSLTNDNRGRNKSKEDDIDAGKDGPDSGEPMLKEVRDPRIFMKDEIARMAEEEHEAVCQWIRAVLIKKPEWAEAFIAVRIDGESIRGYAARIGVGENSITQKLNRATKKLKENYPNRKI